MKAIPSFQNHVKPAPDKSVYKKTAESIDFTKLYCVRRSERKANINKSARRYDPVFFVDLPGSADYVKYFSDCVDEDAVLNIKGPFADLHYTFKLIEPSTENADPPTERLESADSTTERLESAESEHPENSESPNERRVCLMLYA